MSFNEEIENKKKGDSFQEMNKGKTMAHEMMRKMEERREKGPDRSLVVPGSSYTKKDFRQLNMRNLFSFQYGWNYERMQGSGYLFLVAPLMQKMYGNNPRALKKALITEAQYFNTSPFFTTIITGLDLALQEKEGEKCFEEVSGLKTGLMGSFASIGDSLFVAIIPTIFGAIAASMALAGNPVGIFIWIAASLAIMCFRWSQLKRAYADGTKLVTELSSRLNTLVSAGTILTLFMVGALIAFVIPVHLPDIAVGGALGESISSISLQSVANMICPCILPAIIVGVIYALLGMEKMTSTKIILIVFVTCIVLGALGWLTV